MMQLKCTTANCQHNLKCHCNAGVIAIDEKGVCDSKIKRAGGALEQTFRELEAGDELLNDAPSAVRCDADCIYNEDDFCRATSLSASFCRYSASTSFSPTISRGPSFSSTMAAFIWT